VNANESNQSKFVYFFSEACSRSTHFPFSPKRDLWMRSAGHPHRHWISAKRNSFMKLLGAALGLFIIFETLL
jgi:hypothetical protein